MATIRQTRINTEEDILKAHELAMQIGRWAGVSVTQQIRFAAAISENSLADNNEVIQLTFIIDEKENGQCILKATLHNESRDTRKEILQLIPGKSLPPFRDSMDPEKEVGYRDMQQFTFALAHDLKNSLTKLKLALALLEDEEMPPVITNYVQIIQRASDRLETITLSLNKVLQLGDSSPDVVKRISPALVFADVQEEFAESLAKKDGEVNADFSLVSELTYIEVHLKSIFYNLLSNSIKYSSPLRPLRLSISAQQRDGKAAFIFSDNGQGIDLAMYREKIFLPFSRFSHSSEGSGIGLYLIKNIVERNGGKIEVESTPGEGTTFIIFLKEYDLPVGEKK
jgi:signal transduction histidine kinase